MVKPFVALAGLAAAVLLTGCGNGSGEASAGEAATDKLPTTVLETVPPTSAVPTTAVPTTAAPTTATPPTASTSTAPSTTTATAAPAGRRGVFVKAPGSSAVVGSGPLRTYTVEVEEVLGLDPTEVAAQVDATLADQRSWIGDGSVSFQRVPEGGSIRILVASPPTVDSRCLPLNTVGELSCRSGSSVNINSDRWAGATDDWTLDLAAYRSYVVNHEVGHILGHNHRSCPGTGQTAPLMMQQTKGLRGCLPNPWPYP
ncbi:MAG: DUF3152 domain-containing protein [Microthrixaceae bacterium]